MAVDVAADGEGAGGVAAGEGDGDVAFGAAAADKGRDVLCTAQQAGAASEAYAEGTDEG